MGTLERAIEIAAGAHAGQVDKAGEPYILHSLRVMLRVTSPEERMAAVLHDVVEDTCVSLQDLISEGFSSEVVSAIEALTKRSGESRIQAAERAAINAPLQGSASDLIKKAMIQLDILLKKQKLPANILLQVHDELLIEVENEALEEVRKITKQVMESVMSLSVPLIVDTNIAKNCAEL